MGARPFEDFLRRALADYEASLRAKGLSQAELQQAMQGARDFAVFLLGAPLSR
jgi:hypothetical protein